jgi:hypothetical protein
MTMTEDQRKKLGVIATKLGTTIEKLLEGANPNDIIAKYTKGDMKILNE